MKKNRAVVFTVSKDLAFAVACVMLDIKRISPNLADEIVIMHNGINVKDQRLMSKILPTRFIKYILPIKSSHVRTDTLHYFTEMVFAKFECLRLLDDYKNVMFLDYDIVLRNDISELLDLCDYGIRILPSINFKVKEQFYQPLEEYDMNKAAVSTAIFVFQDHLKCFREMYKFCYDCVIKYGKQLYLPEQAVFDIVFQEFDLKFSAIERNIYCVHPSDRENGENAKILHAYGQPKFWNGLKNEQWEKNYKTWLEMGGSKYKKKSFYTKLRNKMKKIVKGI